jgi:hypothetical protein
MPRVKKKVGSSEGLSVIAKPSKALGFALFFSENGLLLNISYRLETTTSFPMTSHQRQTKLKLYPCSVSAQLALGPQCLLDIDLDYLQGKILHWNWSLRGGNA